MKGVNMDLNIGIPVPENFRREVDVSNLQKVVTEVQAATAEMQEAVEELKRIRLGTGLVTGVDLSEEAP